MPEASSANGADRPSGAARTGRADNPGPVAESSGAGLEQSGSAGTHGPVAVLYQAIPPPLIGGVRKPLKPGGYSDSGADIAYVLRTAGQAVITPVAEPALDRDLDWVFPDHEDGIAAARQAGAEIIWANTILFCGHPLEALVEQELVERELVERGRPAPG